MSTELGNGTGTDPIGCKSSLKSAWLRSIADGSFLTFKHSPASVGEHFDRHRSILSPDLSQNLEQFISSGEYDVYEYYDASPNHTPKYYVLTPHNQAYSIPGSGIPSFNLTPTTACDRLVAVSGQTSGWHIFAEQSSEIAHKVDRGELAFIRIMQ